MAAAFGTVDRQTIREILENVNEGELNLIILCGSYTQICSRSTKQATSNLDLTLLINERQKNTMA